MFKQKIRSKLYTFSVHLLMRLVNHYRIKSFASESSDKLAQLKKYPMLGSSGNLDLSIIISTFEMRFFEFTIPLISMLRKETSLPIFVMINGNYEKNNHNRTLEIFLFELAKFSNIYPTTFANFQGCATLWNRGIINSDCKYNLILNDDILIDSKSFLQDLSIFEKLMMQNELVTINNTFSHFGISRRCIDKVGFFDEHFLGIGWEDSDYISRFESYYQKPPTNIFLESFIHLRTETSESDVKKDPNTKYSQFNREIFEYFYDGESPNKNQLTSKNSITRKHIFIDPHPIWKFRNENYKKLQN
jgi:hypothetical protein